MTICELPNDIEALKHLVIATHQQVVDREAQLADREARIKELQSQIAYLKRTLFGQRSEKIDPQQLLLFRELQSQVEALQEEAEQEEVHYTRRKGHGRRPLPDDLPVEEVVYPLENTDCPCCGESMGRIGEEVTDEVDFHPGSMFCRRHIRPKYACRKCAEGVHIAPMPPRPIDKGIAGPGLLAHVLTSKYADHCPLNRLQGQLRRHRLEVSVSSLCDWVARMSDLLTPIYDGLKASLLAGDLIQADETPVPYQLDTLKKKTATGYLWTYLCESPYPCDSPGLRDSSRMVLYDFTTSRSRAGPSQFLEGFSGRLITDGYGGYHEAVERAHLTHAGCWAHARRKFYDARMDDRRRCGQMLKLIQALFAIERKAKDLPATERLTLRQAESAPLLHEICVCADAWSQEVLPRGSVGQAVNYLRNQWRPLTRFVDDATIPLDNNASERAMRHVVIGRKNWTFAGSAAGGHRAAKIFSIAVTCRSIGLDPFAYLRDVIDRLPRGEDPALLLPSAWKATQLISPSNNASA